MSRTVLIQQIKMMKDSLYRDRLIRLNESYPPAEGWVIYFQIEHDEGTYWEIRVVAQKDDDIHAVRIKHERVELILQELIRNGAAKIAFERYKEEMNVEIERARLSLFGPDQNTV
jgi:hypothetical protein